jgi:hypothetical protein
MSTVGAPSSNNPYAYLQPTKRPGQAQSSAAQGDPQSQQFAVTAPQSTSAASSTTAASTATASSGSATSTSSSTFPRFEPQTLQALLALQSDN